MKNIKINLNNKINSIFKILLLFCTVYSIHLTMLPFTLRNLFILLAIIIYIYKCVKSKKIYLNKRYVLFLISCLLIYFINILIVHINKIQAEIVTTLIDYSFNFMILVGLFPIIIRDFFDSTDDFCKSLFVANSIQSFIVILSALLPGVRRLLGNIQILDTSRYTYRIYGLGIAGAGGSIYLFCGFIVASLLIINNNKIANKLTFFIVYICNFIAIAFVGRTGFYAALALLIYVFIFLFKNMDKTKIKKISKIIITMFFLLFIYIYIYNYITMNLSTLSYTYERLFELFSGESQTLNALENMNEHIPRLDFDMLFWGTGVARGYTSRGFLVWHDGGYAQRYAAMGLFLAMISYMFFYNILIKNIKLCSNKNVKGMMIFLVLITIIIEYKEPFIYKLALPFTLLMISWLASDLKEKEK